MGRPLSPRGPVLVGLALAVLLVAVIAVVFAAPIPDGDLFWHMAYARQMLDHGTLRLDHTTFSWTPASNETIYCAWASELALNWLWNHVGLWSLFALRYAVLLFAAGLTWDFARRLGRAAWPWTFFVLLVTALASSAGTLIKPELFSLLFMNLAVWAFFRGRLAAQQGASPVRWFYLVPLLFLLWVNFHGAHILFAPFLVATAVGEGLNLAYGSAARLSARAYRHLLLAWGLCGVAELCTPYGWAYPWQLFCDNVLGATPRPDAVWNSAMRSVFAPADLGLNLLELGCIMAALLLAVSAWRIFGPGRRRAGGDATLVLVNLAYVPLFIVYLRSTWFWAPVFAYSFLFAVGAAPAAPAASPGPAARAASGRLFLQNFAVAAFLCLGGAAVWSTWRYPSPRNWLGFGFSYVNPVPEAEFLAASKLGPRLINLFDNGGYLLWRLWPRYRVMTDQRSFPYLSWFADQYAFSQGENFEAFLAAHPADAAVIDLERNPVWRKFQHAKDWKLAYYGPTAAVFVHASVALDQLATNVAPERFAELKNPEVAFLIFRFACAVADYPTAWRAEEQLRTHLRFQADPEQLWIAADYRAAHQALRERDYAKASRLFDAAIPGLVFSDRDQLIHILLTNLARPDPQGSGDEAAVYEAALAKLAAPP